ncbi:hypothetical protein MCHUDSM44219_00249 [Mycolicibacterium chubuense]|uniref:Uncharacterized protein n=1 Tax=Mycolicibacterium chubuense TaxID=1800 RepID=A0A0J6WSY0_MYCCU|nr:hypothetical protein MCHUDSM44219_00249 [Mycolicibacterium chubuense]
MIAQITHLLEAPHVDGDCIDATQLVLGVGEHAGHRVQRTGDQLGAAAPLLVGEFVQRRGRRPGLQLLGAAAFTGGARVRGGTLAVGGRVRRRRPVALQLLVEPHHRQRAARHVQARDELTHLGFDDLVAPLAQQPRHGAPDHEQFLVLGAAQSVQDDRETGGLRVGTIGEHAVDECVRERLGGGHGLVGDAGLPVDAQPHAHLALRHGEQRMVGAGHRAPVERHPQRAGRRVGCFGDPDHPGEIETLFGGGAGALEHREIACDAASFVFFPARCARDVVGDGEVVGVDPLAAQLRHRQTEVHHVAGVVAGGEQHTGVPVRGTGHRCRLLGRRRGEDVADDGAVGEPGSDSPAERRIVTRAAADDDGHLARPGAVGADDAAGYPGHIPRIRVEEAGEHVLGETGRIVVQLGHRRRSPESLSNRYTRSAAAVTVTCCSDS